MSFALLPLRRFSPVVAGLLLLAGCRPDEKIARYTVPKPNLVNPASANSQAKPQQMLGAVVLVGPVGWFFKLTGDPAEVSRVEEPFLKFVRSLEIAGEGAEPKWTLPEGWKARPGDQLRFATIEIPSASKPLELSVTSLGREVGDDQGYLLANINRWRGQLNLTELTAEQLPIQAIQFQVSGFPCTLVNMVGTGSGSMTAPFAGAAAAGSGSAPVSRPAPGATGLSYQAPAGWKEGKLNAFRKAAFEVNEGDKRVEITVINLSPSPLDANVDRWAKEIGAAPPSAENLATVVSKIDVAGQQADYVQLVSSADAPKRERTLGVIIPRGDMYWFVKLRGDAELAEREKDNFEAFVKSLRFE